MATERFGKYELANAGNCIYSNFGDLLEIHQEEIVGLSLTEFSLAQSKWGSGKESVRVLGGNLFSNSTVRATGYCTVLPGRQYQHTVMTCDTQTLTICISYCLKGSIQSSL